MYFYYVFLCFLHGWWIIMESDIISIFRLFWFFRLQVLRVRIGYKFWVFRWQVLRVRIGYKFWVFRWQVLRVRIGYKFWRLIFWSVLSCILTEKCQNFERSFCLHLQGWRWTQQVFIFATVPKAMFLNTLPDISGTLTSDPLVLAS